MMEWEQLLAPFVSKQRRSKVLVTSRSSTLPAALHCKPDDLKDMNDAEFSKLFNHYAFSGEDIPDPRLRENLEDIANKIAKRLGQSPLAAKTVGSQLSRKKDIATWKDALKNDNLADARSALIWSYEKLDPPLQRCFLYCSLFPKGHRYNGDVLVRLWTAEGFFDSRNQNKRMEDIAKGYLDTMVYCSFFQRVSKDRFYIMHDLLHDLAESLSKEDCFRLEDDNVSEIPCTIRHLSIFVKSMVQHEQSVCKLQHLRTVISIGRLEDDASDTFHRVLQNSNKLRVLHLSNRDITRLPESFGELKHLRYLDIGGTGISELPRSLCTLYHLQVLFLSGFVDSLPDAICNLSKLQYYHGPAKISNVGQLTSLQRLDYFRVKNEKGYVLRQLGDLNEIGGSLSILDLENVGGKVEAMESTLHQKIHLEQRALSWSHVDELPAEDGSHLEILEGLRPPPQLKRLTVNGYQSATYPNWLLEGSYFENLEQFKLKDCRFLHCLPPDIPASLQEVSIEKCPMLMFILNEELEQCDIQRRNMTREDYLVSRLPLLREAESHISYTYIESCLWEEHSSLTQLKPLMDADISQPLLAFENALAAKQELVQENTIRSWLFCHEQRVKLLYGRKRIGMPLVLPSALRELALSSCSITDGALAVCLGCLTSLERLNLSYIMTIDILPSEEVMRHLTSLVFLGIACCWFLRSLGGLRAATLISWICLSCCPSLELARGAESMPLSLDSLRIQTCVLGPDFFCCDLPHLSEITIERCRSSSLSIGHLMSLKSISLRDMPDLCMVEGFSSRPLDEVNLVRVPKLDAGCISHCRVQESLTVSSSAVLNHMLSGEGFACFKRLRLSNSDIHFLPPSLKSFSCLERLQFWWCPNISALPDLPASIEEIEIWDCPLLKESCREPNGESWPKIAHIPWKVIY